MTALSNSPVFIATNRFPEDEPYYRNALIMNLPSPTHDAIALTTAALKALEPLYRAD
jgi:hypothetical protein